VVQPLSKGRATEVRGSVACPPDKSVTHRSVMFAAMAKGESRVVNPLLGADCRSTMGVFRALGVTIDHVNGSAGAAGAPGAVGAENGRGGAPNAIVVRSPGWDGWTSPVVPLDFGNSGTTARLLTGVLAATPGLFVTAFGDQSLSKRPMGRVVTPLRSVGARISGRQDGHLLPFAIEGARLEGVRHAVDKASAQVKSALILAGLNVDGETVVTLPAGGRDHTERMLKALGADLMHDIKGRTEIIGVRGPFRPTARTFEVPGDPSSAAFLLVHVAMLEGGKVTVRGVLDNPTRTGFVTVLERMGARLTKGASAAGAGLLEPVQDLTVEGGAALKGVDVEPELVPTLIDEIPILAVLALVANGPSRFRGLAELRVKESDRLAKTLELLHAAGGKAHAEGDDLIVEGGLTSAAPFSYDPDEDHRLAMAAAVLARVARGPCEIKDPDCVAVSFPEFFPYLDAFDRPAP
jgi:3-phosphoshikimate 1-carboxyvinyltransferase